MFFLSGHDFYYFLYGWSETEKMENKKEKK